MPIPSFTGLQTALSGLEAAQAELNTTGANIANESTPGYSREDVVTTDSDPLSVPAISRTTGTGAQLGTGVSISNITRVHDQFLDVQYRTQNSLSNLYSTQYNNLDQVQTALGESDGTGLSNALDKFWRAWTDLGQSPTAASQQEVLSAGATVASTLNQVSSQLTTIENQTQSQWSALTAYAGDLAGNTSDGQVANDAKQIASLNAEIAQAQGANQTPNALLDQRDELIDDLSQYANVAVTRQADGMVDVSFGNAAASPSSDQTPLVEGETANLQQNLTEANLNASAGGKLGALESLYDSTTGTGTLAGYVAKLDGVASQLAGDVQGALTGSGIAPDAFFTDTDGSGLITAATIEVNPRLTAGKPYSAAQASAVSALSDDNSTAQQDYQALVTQIGSDTQSANSSQTTAQSLLTSIGNQRQSVSGVSLDEEMTNLITYQQAYQASARMMTAIDDTLQTLINMGSSAGM